MCLPENGVVAAFRIPAFQLQAFMIEHYENRIDDVHTKGWDKSLQYFQQLAKVINPTTIFIKDIKSRPVEREQEEEEEG